jgi:Tat protein secretion system quality control protein TatD with DNase activity
MQFTLVCIPVNGNAVLLWSNVALPQLPSSWHIAQSVGKPAVTWFGGVVTFARDYDEQIKSISVDRILTETDAPYVSPEPYRGQRNEPAYVSEVVKKLAEIKGISYDEMVKVTEDNARRIFKIPS